MNGEPGRLIWTLEAPDVKSEFDCIAELGAEVVREPYTPGDSESGVSLCTFADPDGNYFQLATPMGGPSGGARSATVQGKPRHQFDDAFGHHVWASLRVLDACAALTPEQLRTSVPGTYGTIPETAHHLVESDTYYLFVITDGRVDRIPEEGMELAELRTVMEANKAH